VAANPALAARLDDLVALFNRRSLDLPDGLFDRRTQFLLNGTPFEAMLGRPPADPLVLMIARGPAGYRFAVKALQHALPAARVERGELVQGDDETGSVTVPLWLSGRLRGSDQPIEAVLRADLVLGGSIVSRADVALDPPLVALFREARLRD
jgi:hypothetical protein